MRPCAFAIPGDYRQKTGGFIYERRLLEELRAAGRDVQLIPLPPASAEPSAEEQDAIARVLGALPTDRPLILDGLVFGAMRTDALARLACPVLAMLHHPMGMENGLPPDLASRLLAQETANLSHADHIAVTSPHTRKTYIGLGADPSRITVALPGHDGPREVPRVDAGPRILSVGLLARRKGHDVLIRALGAIRELDWTARIVGKTHDPQVRDELAALIADLGLADRIELAGELSDADLDEAYRSARLFALATRYEGYGMALAEALCHGLPIVTCATGAVPDTVGSAALLSPPDDVDGFSRNLARLLRSEKERAELSEQSKALARDLPRWSDTAATVGQVLDRL